MRFLALLPIALSICAVVLSFLIIFAGDKPGFMESYDLLTLNVSRIGQNLINDTSGSDSGLLGLIQNATDQIEGDINSDLNSLATSLAKVFGLQDFYSAHMLDYCEGYYTPGPVPNATLHKHDIHKNVTHCSNKTSMFTFDPRTALEQSIEQSGNPLGGTVNETLQKLDWPQDIEDSLHALRIAWKAMFILYCIGIGLSFLCLLFSLFGFVQPNPGRGIPAVNILLFLLAFLTLLCASGIATAIAEKGTKEINKYGKVIGVSASVGWEFLVITWVATGAMFFGAVTWCVGCIAPRRRHEVHKTG